MKTILTTFGMSLFLCAYSLAQVVQEPERDAVAGIDVLKAEAMDGDPSVQYEIGRCYFEGRNTDKDYALAAEWFAKAAMAGHMDSQTALGSCYQKGLGVGRDNAKAIEWFTKAAEQGSSSAQLLLAKAYYNNRICSR